jgi:hypothetical protein
MRYQVPQFINIEDKIFGSLTLKQFIYIAGGIGICILIWRVIGSISLILTIIVCIPFAGLAAALAFGTPNGRPFIFILEAWFNFILSSKLYIWKKREKKPEAKQKITENIADTVFIPKLSNSKLRDLTWSLDINEGSNPGTKETYENQNGKR